MKLTYFSVLCVCAVLGLVHTGIEEYRWETSCPSLPCGNPYLAKYLKCIDTNGNHVDAEFCDQVNDQGRPDCHNKFDHCHFKRKCPPCGSMENEEEYPVQCTNPSNGWDHVDNSLCSYLPTPPKCQGLKDCKWKTICPACGDVDKDYTHCKTHIHKHVDRKYCEYLGEPEDSSCDIDRCQWAYNVTECDGCGGIESYTNAACTDGRGSFVEEWLCGDDERPEDYSISCSERGECQPYVWELVASEQCPECSDTDATFYATYDIYICVDNTTKELANDSTWCDGKEKPETSIQLCTDVVPCTTYEWILNLLGDCAVCQPFGEEVPSRRVYGQPLCVVAGTDTIVEELNCADLTPPSPPNEECNEVPTCPNWQLGDVTCNDCQFEDESSSHSYTCVDYTTRQEIADQLCIDTIGPEPNEAIVVCTKDLSGCILYPCRCGNEDEGEIICLEETTNTAVSLEACEDYDGSIQDCDLECDEVARRTDILGSDSDMLQTSSPSHDAPKYKTLIVVLGIFGVTMAILVAGLCVVRCKRKQEKRSHEMENFV